MSDVQAPPTFDDFLREEGIYEEVTAAAIKRVIAWEVEQRRKALGLSKTALAKKMGTSRSQLDRFLDPTNDNVELRTFTGRRRPSAANSGSNLCESSRAGAGLGS